LKEATIVATLSPTGQVKSVDGFKEIYDKFMGQFGDELIDKNMDQLFRIFPDSAVHIGDKWQLNSKQKGEIGLNTANSFTLTDIHDGTAFIESDGTITSDSVSSFMGSHVTTDLKGQQKGEFQVDIKSGMLVSAKVTLTVKGSLSVMGREIRLTIESSQKMDRH